MFPKKYQKLFKIIKCYEADKAEFRNRIKKLDQVALDDIFLTIADTQKYAGDIIHGLEIMKKEITQIVGEN